MITLILVVCLIYGIYLFYSKRKTSGALAFVIVACLALDVASICSWNIYKVAPEKLQAEMSYKASIEEDLAERKASISEMTPESQEYFCPELELLESKMKNSDEQIQFYERVLNRGNEYLNFLIAFGLLDKF